jgi:hypothetical protein
MRTTKEIKQYAKGIAEGQFYSDDECKIPHILFEYEDPADIKRECKMLAMQIENAMLWALGGKS